VRPSIHGWLLARGKTEILCPLRATQPGRNAPMCFLQSCERKTPPGESGPASQECPTFRKICRHFLFTVGYPCIHKATGSLKVCPDGFRSQSKTESESLKIFTELVFVKLYRIVTLLVLCHILSERREKMYNQVASVLPYKLIHRYKANRQKTCTKGHY